MRIKKLELFGFKSFKDRTVIHFDAGITGIVGPNGCGKSNIVDALVWVMGEMSAKHLRGSNMSDVIFAGADGFAPMGMAEVSLTLENDGGAFPAKYSRFSEIMITRRLHRSGESEYLINKEPSRLRDIHEIFMDTGAGAKGFSIIEQGAIGKIVTAKPEDRKVLIEEAAGITKFKVRKRESQRKLASTDQNLVRLQDIIGEQKRQLNSLERQAQRAERYRKIKNELRDKDMWLSSTKYLEAHEEAVRVEGEVNEVREQETAASADISRLEAELEQIKLEMAEREAQVTNKQVENKATQDGVVTLEKEIRELEFEVETARRNKEMTGSIVEQYQARKKALDTDYEAIKERHDLASEQADRLEGEYQSEEGTLTDVLARIQQADDELTVKRREMLAVSQSESHMDARLVSLQAQTEEARERLSSTEQIEKELQEKKTEFEARFKKIHADLENEKQLQLDIMSDVSNFSENLNGLESQKQIKTEEVERVKDGLNEVASRLYGLENLSANFEGFQEGVKSIMLWQREREHGSSYKPLAEVIEVPQQYELAMEASLGRLLQALITESSDSCLEAVEHLKSNNSGRSSLLAATSSRNYQDISEKVIELKQEQGVSAVLADVVSVPEQHQSVVENFLNRVVIVETIQTGLGLRDRFPEFTFVTLEGDTLSADGILTGGTSESAESGVLKRRREIKELSQSREELAGRLAVAQAELKKIEAQFESVQEQLEGARTRNVEKEVTLAELNKDLERAENELSNANQALERQVKEVTKERETINRQEEQAQEISHAIAETREKKLDLENNVERLDLELKELRSGIDEKQNRVSQLRADSAAKRQEYEGLKHQLEMVQKSLDEVNHQLGQMSEESEKTTESMSANSLLIERSRVDLENRIREAEQVEKQLSQLKDEFEQYLADAREKEETVSSSLRSLNEFKASINDAQLKLEQLKMREQYLVDQINERYMLNLTEVAPQYRNQEGDFEAIEKEVDDLKAKLGRIGEVNLSAIEEYDDLTSRYEFLTQQHQDLMEAKEQLRKVIDRINRICTRRFKETFDLVNERFTKVFPVLFGGGEARLILVEDELKGEMGIDIVSKPPGKKMQNVSLLSGGEKALTAVSLIFSIFLVKPSPYCLLDEVDAPLDDANVFRFNDLVKEMSKRSQIIVVTHNKHTMRVNSKLYGVTMQDKGVSKMVSVSLDEAVKVAEI